MNDEPGPLTFGVDLTLGPPSSYQLMVQFANTIIGLWAAELRRGVTPDRQRELTRMMLLVRNRRDDVGAGDDLSATAVHRQLLELPHPDLAARTSVT